MIEVSPGQWWQRVLAIFVAGCSAWLFVKWAEGRVAGIIFAVSCVLFFLFFLISVPPLYRHWMKFAERLSVWVMRIIFSVIYFFFLPFFLFFRSKDRLGLKNSKDKQSLWIVKTQHVDTLEDMQRMG